MLKETQKSKTSVDVKTEVPVKIVNVVTMQDGTSKNFGKCGKLLSTTNLKDESFELIFHVVDGSQISYNFIGSKDLLLQMAAFGAEAKIKAACAGLPVTEIEKAISLKIAEFNDNNFVSRVSGKPVAVLSQIQLAYAIVNDIDVSNTEGVVKVNSIFATFTKEDKSALYKSNKIQLELAKLKLQAAETALKLETDVV